MTLELAPSVLALFIIVYNTINYNYVYYTINYNYRNYVLSFLPK
jgi:hypothetical protein